MELWSLLSITAPGALPRARPVRRVLRATRSRRDGDARAARPAPPADPAAPAAPHQGPRGRRPARRSRSRCSRSSWTRSTADLRDPPAARAAEGARPARRLRQEPVRDLPVADAAAAAQPRRRRWSTTSTSDVPSAKLDALVDQLSEIVAEGHRALVFSQFTRFLARVRHRLDAGRHRVRATSTAAPASGPTVIDDFKDGDAPVFLISLKAGGFGLNLTEADYCFVLDPWWNPATEAQAVDRTHRIGQTRNVMVYRLVAEDTIEEKVMALKARKAELFARRDGRRRPLRGPPRSRRRAGALQLTAPRLHPVDAELLFGRSQPSGASRYPMVWLGGPTPSPPAAAPALPPSRRPRACIPTAPSSFVTRPAAVMMAGVLDVRSECC